MDELGLSRAIDRLNQELSPGEGDRGLLEMARRVRGLREPAWPADPTAFAQSLLPHPGAPRSKPTVQRTLRSLSAAAAAVLVAAAVGSSTMLRRVTSLPLPGFAVTGNAVSSARPSHGLKSVQAGPVQGVFATAQAPAQTPTHASAQIKSAAPMTDAAMLPALHLDGVSLVQGPPRRVEIRVHLQNSTRLNATGASLSNLFSHRNTVRISLQTAQSGSGREWIVRLPVPSQPGWYLLDLGSSPREIAFFVPYPAGSTIVGSARASVAKAPSGAVSLEAVHYGSTYTDISLHLAAAPGTWTLRLHVPGAVPEAPLRTVSLHGSADSVKATFNPIVQGSGIVYLEVILPPRTVWLELPTP